VQFGLFLSKFGCHGNSLGSFEILASIFEVADTDNLTIHVKKSLISCTQLKSAQCLLIFAHIRLPWQIGNSPDSLEILYSIFEFAGPKNLTIYAIISSIPCTQLNSSNFGFLPVFGCHGNSLCSLENSGSIFELTNSVYSNVHAKYSSFFARN